MYEINLQSRSRLHVKVEPSRYNIGHDDGGAQTPASKTLNTANHKSPAISCSHV